MKVDEEDWSDCSYVKGPLYVKEWNTKLYLQGLHVIKVYITHLITLNWNGQVPLPERLRIFLGLEHLLMKSETTVLPWS